MEKEEYIKYRVKETGDIVFRIKGEPSRFIDGKEYIAAKRWEDDKITSYILKTSLEYYQEKS